MTSGLLLVERDAELASLAAAVMRARSGSGQFVMVEGVAGIGKSSLLARAAEVAAGTGVRVLTARGTDLERQFSFGLVRQMFEPVLGQMTAARRQELLADAAGAAAVVFGPVGEHEQVKEFAVLHGLYWLTANLCRDQLLVMSVDDLHWADPGSLRFLAYLQPRLEGLPLAVLAAIRPEEPGAEKHLLNLLMVDPTCTLLHPAPLTPAGSAEVMRADLTVAGARVAGRPQVAESAQPDPSFLAACHSATGGNPLLLHALARALSVDGVAPTAANAGRVPTLGPRALADRIELRLAGLPAACTSLARAVAVLGDSAQLASAAALTALDGAHASVAAGRLQQLQILQPTLTMADRQVDQVLRFTHPLVQSAIYNAIHPAERIVAHAAAANWLTAAHADPEHIALHLMRVPASGDQQAARVLHQAAKDAFSHGSPDAAVAFLERCMQEPPPETDRLEVLTELCAVSSLVNEAAAAGYLRQALQLTTDSHRRAELTDTLAKTLLQLLRTDELVALCTSAAQGLPVGEDDARRRLEANILHICLLQPNRPDVLSRVAALRDLPVRASIGARELDCEIALIDALAAEPAAVARARRALGDGLLVHHGPGEPPAVAGWITLLAGDDPLVMESLDAVIAQEHRRGSARALAPAYAFRGWSWLWRGQLAEAESEVRKSKALVEMANIEAGRAFVASFLADILIERGQLADARAILESVGQPEPMPPVGAVFFFQETWARLLRTEGRYDEALRAALACGRRFAAHGGQNPALVGWRCEAALCLHKLGRDSEAQAMSAEELELARRWGAPRALGRALRVAGLVHHGSGRHALLTEAVGVLASSPAQLEFAKAQIDLGIVLHRDGRTADAKSSLVHGLDLAHRCGAVPMADRAESALRSAGARPRRSRLSGPESLTPSELKVARLAAEGHSNRGVAQELFVTVKTVEVHLSSVYRKLGVSRRDQLAALLARSLRA